VAHDVDEAIAIPIEERKNRADLEVVSDALGSIGVIVAAVIMFATGWYYADPIFSVLIGLFILPRTWKLLVQAVNVLLESTPAHINVAAAEEAMLNVKTEWRRYTICMSGRSHQASKH